MVAAALTDIAGSSDVFDRGFVTYSNAAKIDMLGVSPATLDAHGAVSEEVAAGNGHRRARPVHRRHWPCPITGIAGPGGSDFKPEGRVCFGLARKGHLATAETVEFGALGRDKVRRAARDRALALLSQALG